MDGRFAIVVPRAVSPAGTFPRIHPPLGAIAVLSEARRNGFDSVLLDAAAEGLLASLSDPSYSPSETETLDGVCYWKTGLRNDEVVKQLDALAPNAIGLSCCTVVDRDEVARLAHDIKSNFPEVPLILGGHEATRWYREILGETAYRIEVIPEVDFVVVGPGQPTVTALLEYLSKPSAHDLPPGVAFRDSGSVTFTGPSTFNPNAHATLDYGLLPRAHIEGRSHPLDLYSYVGNPHAGRIGSILASGNDPISYLPLLTSYGCGFDCSFCDTDKKLVRYRVEAVMAMVEQFRTLYGIDYIDIMDNNFGGGPQPSRAVAFAILSEFSRESIALGFSNGLTFESMMREQFRLLQALAEHGNVRHIAFPCENGNDRVLRMVRKPHNITMIRETLEAAAEIPPSTNREGFFIGGFPETGGEPAERPDELEATFDFMTGCLEENLLDQAIFLTLSPVTREYRSVWRATHPEAPFEHCLFSRQTGIWPYAGELLDEMHARFEEFNYSLDRAVTRRL